MKKFVVIFLTLFLTVIMFCFVVLNTCGEKIINYVVAQNKTIYSVSMVSNLIHDQAISEDILIKSNVNEQTEKISNEAHKEASNRQDEITGENKLKEVQNMNAPKIIESNVKEENIVVPEINSTDKIAIMTLIFSKLSKEDIDKLTKIAKDGVTDLEKDEIEKIVQNRLNQNEIFELKKYYKKYFK